LARGEVSPEIALTLILLANSETDPAGKIAALAEADRGSAPLAQLGRLVATHAARVRQAQTLIESGIDPAPADSSDGIVAATRAHFDRLAADAPEAGVALYSLGDPDLLAAATAELVETIVAWTDLGGRSVLDFGCGIGRVASAIAPLARKVVGVDLSPAMIAQAQARGAALNLSYCVGNGVDLAEWEDGSFDLFLAVDSFPYLVRAGERIARRHVDEAARLLRPGGELLVFNWSYRGDLAQDAADAARFGEAAGFRMLRAGEQPLRVWNGAGFHLVRA
jgi:SAM-dependent methyltransferase